MQKFLIEGLPQFKIRRGIVHVVFDDHDTIEICIPLADFRAAASMAVETLAQHDAKSAKVIPIRKRPPKH